jgi:glycine oxidase ThiO
MSQTPSQAPDSLVIGGGAMGLSIAIALAQQGMQVTVLSRDFGQAALQAAAGMLAPQAEVLPAGPLQTLCLASRSLYPEWIAKLERLSGLDSGYWPCGILAPAFAADLGTAHTNPTEPGAYGSEWLKPEVMQQRQPGLSSDLVGGWWYPEDAQVDNRALAHMLRVVAQELGITFLEGVTVTQIERCHGQVVGLASTAGPLRAGSYVVTTGAWSADLVSLPVFPRKGQMLAVQSNPNHPLALRQVIFANGTYLVPRRDGRIIIGATSEDVGFAAYNTPDGVQALLHRAIEIYPPIKDCPILEFWWGFRPTVSDLSPVLGQGLEQNLYLATGHYRNGILLAPITAKLLADLIISGIQDPLLEAFSWQRFGVEA